jgi:hypothetical protein
MWIPVGVEYAATATGETLKLAECESCHAEYCYVLRSAAVGFEKNLFLMNPNARDFSQSIAEKELRDALRDGFDAVPCPQCGWYQRYMIKTFNRRRFARMLLLGERLLMGFGALTLASLLAYAIWGLGWFIVLFAGAGVVGVLGLIYTLKYHFAVVRFDPNRLNKDERIMTAKSGATLKEELQRANHPALDKASMCEALYPRLRVLLARWHPSAEAMSDPSVADREMRVRVQCIIDDEPLPLNQAERRELGEMLMHKAFPNRERPRSDTKQPEAGH